MRIMLIIPRFRIESRENNEAEKEFARKGGMY